MASVAEHIAMISLAAEAMGPELCRVVTFVGDWTEDILTLIDGRPELLQEILDSTDELKKYFSEQFSLLLKHGDFAYAIQSAAGDDSRQALLEEKIKTIISYACPGK